MENIKRNVNNDQFKIKFDGEVHDINAVTFIKTINNINSIITEINKVLI